MSVYRPAKSRYFHYDFVVKGVRFSGSTGAETKRAAQEHERQKRQDIKAGSAGPDAGGWFLSDALLRWYDERAADSRSASDVERRVKMIAACMPLKITLREITGAVVSNAIDRRRGKLVRGKTVPSNATVNRDIIAPLRATLRRARLVWGAKNMPEIAWGELALPEAAGLVCEYTDAQVEEWSAKAGPIGGLAVRIMCTYGLRFGELFFDPSKLDVIGARVTLSDRKAGPDLVVPLLDDDARDLGKLAAVALAKGWDTVWADDVGPMSYWSLHWRLSKAGREAGLTNPRIIHGARHHAATRIVRASNLAVAKQLLGHATIVSTARYAHAMEKDVRGALEGLSARQSRMSPGPAATNKTKAEQ